MTLVLGPRGKPGGKKRVLRYSRGDRGALFPAWQQHSVLQARFGSCAFGGIETTTIFLFFRQAGCLCAERRCQSPERSRMRRTVTVVIRCHKLAPSVRPSAGF